MPEFLVIQVEEDGHDGLTHLCEAETFEAAIAIAATEGGLSGSFGIPGGFREGPTQITDWMVRACRNELADKLDGAAPSDADMRTIIAGDVELRRCLLTSYSGVDAGGDHDRGLDTYDREYLLEAFATDFLESPFGWPNNGSEEHETVYFLQLIMDAVKDGRLKPITPEAP